MQHNEGWPDRITRFVAGVMLLRRYGAASSPWKYLTLTGLALIATAMTGHCPLYALLGSRTCRRQGRSSSMTRHTARNHGLRRSMSSRSVARRQGSCAPPLATRSLAPSTHNTQPWLFRVRGSTLDLYADRSRVQPVVDPDQRELTISCGAGSLYTFRLTLCPVWARLAHQPAARSGGPGSPRSGVTLDGPVEPRSAAPTRSTTAISDPPDEPESLRLARDPETGPLPRAVAAVEAQGARIEMVLDAAVPGRRCARLVAEADPGPDGGCRFRHELARSLHSNRSGKRDGMPGHALGMGDLASAVASGGSPQSSTAGAARPGATSDPDRRILRTRWCSGPGRTRRGTGSALDRRSPRSLLNLQADGVCGHRFLNQPLAGRSAAGMSSARLLACPGRPSSCCGWVTPLEVAPTPRRDPSDVIINLVDHACKPLIRGSPGAGCRSERQARRRPWAPITRSWFRSTAANSANGPSPSQFNWRRRNGARLELTLVHQPIQGFATAMEMPEVGAGVRGRGPICRERAYLDQTHSALAQPSTTFGELDFARGFRRPRPSNPMRRRFRQLTWS